MKINPLTKILWSEQAHNNNESEKNIFLNKNILSNEEISKYAGISFLLEKSIDGKEYVDLSFNPELKDILEKDWIEIIRIILCSRLKLSNPKLKIEWDKILISRYWISSDNLDNWIDELLINDLKSTLDNLNINPKPLVDAITVIQDAIYTDAFLDSIFHNISEKQNLVFFDNFFNNHLEDINLNSRINIFNNEVTLFHAIKIIKEAWKKIWKDNLFNDFKEASLKNISKIAREKWIL